MIVTSGPYYSNCIYWLLVGKRGQEFQYDLLGRFIDGKFEFNDDRAKDGYIFREDIKSILALLSSDTEEV